MEIYFFVDDEIKKVDREVNEPDHIFDARATFVLTYDDVLMSNIHANKVFNGYRYSPQIEEKYEMIVGGQNKTRFNTDDTGDIELTDIDLVGNVTGNILVFNQYCKINTDNKKVMKVVNVSVKNIVKEKYDFIVLHFSFSCIKYIISFFAAVNEALTDDGTFIIADNIFDKIIYKQVFGTLYERLLGNYFDETFYPRFLAKRQEIPGLDLYDVEEFDDKTYCRMIYKKKSFVPLNITEKIEKYDVILQFRYAEPVNKVQKVGDIIYFNLSQKDFRADKYSEIFVDMEKLIDGVVAFNKKGLEKTLRWEKIYFEFKKLAYKLKSTKFIIISKKNE